MVAQFSEAVDDLPDDYLQHPHDYLAMLRAGDGVRNVVFPHGSRVWLVTRYEDVRTLLASPLVSKDGRRMNEMFARHAKDAIGVEEEEEPGSVGFDDDLSCHMLNSDPPRHTRLRDAVSKAFNLRRIEAYRPRIDQVVGELLDAMADQAEVDMIAGLARPLPVTIMCDVLGIPFADRDTFSRWAVELVGAGHDPEVVEAASENVVEYAGKIIEAKRREPGDDMVSALLETGEDADRLTDSELVAMIFLMVVAGHVTTMYTLSNAIYSLLTHPDEMARLRADPSLTPAAVDELMRYDGGVAVGTFRFTAAEITVGDVVIPKGEILALSLTSANRDEARFPDADKLDLTRHPHGVLGFGHGIHYCIGQPLAKIQLEVAIRQLITRYPDARVAVDPAELRWITSALMRGLETLPVSLDSPASG
jgi:cytochrome P450